MAPLTQLCFTGALLHATRFLEAPSSRPRAEEPPREATVTKWRNVSRRPVLGGLVAAGMGVPAGWAVSEKASMSQVPSYTMLIPLVELSTTIESWMGESPELAQPGLDALAKGGIFSAKNYYLGIGGKYYQSIVYDDLDKGLVRRERESRFTALVDADSALDRAQQKKGSLADARDALDRFLALAPRRDVDEARRALAALVASDKNGDGVVDEAEFFAADSPLTQTDRIAATWGVWSGAISEDLRPPYAGYVKLNISSSALPAVPEEFRAPIRAMQF